MSEPQGRTLREVLQERGNPQLPLNDAIKAIVPLCVQAADLHRQGYGVYLHPSNTTLQGAALHLISEKAATPPELPRDLACMPPEFAPGQMGDARASVYSIGAMLYELVTGGQAGPSMRRPSRLVAGLPPEFDVLLANALIAAPEHRPADLNALAEAIYNLAPRVSAAPPPKADNHRVSMLAVDVDVSLSMLPPDEDPRMGYGVVPSIPRAPAMPRMALPVERAPAAGPNSGLGIGTLDARVRPQGDAATEELAAMKARVESDPRPRYVVVKEGMDHGPFSGIELLQQLGSHAFVLEDTIVDQVTSEERLVAAWPQFAPFAEHAKRHRDLQAEKVAIDLGVRAESKKTKSKALLGLALMAALGAGAGVWLLSRAGTRSDEVAVHTENAANIEAEGDVKTKKKVGSGGGKRSRVVGSQAGIPILSGGLSCEGARAAYVEEISMTGGQADIPRGLFANILNRGWYFSHCGVPASGAVSICAAVQNGRAVGVSVSTKPSHGSRSCISSAVRKLTFPSHPKLDVVRVSFAAQ